MCLLTKFTHNPKINAVLLQAFMDVGRAVKNVSFCVSLPESNEGFSAFFFQL